MKSKGFKVIVGVLVVLIVAVGGLLVVKTMGLAGGDAGQTKAGREIRPKPLPTTPASRCLPTARPPSTLRPNRRPA